MKILAYIILALSLCACTKNNCTITDKIFAFKGDSAAHQTINEMLRKKFAELKTEIASETAEAKRDPETTHLQYEVAAETKVYVNTPKFFSARNDYYTYTGGAHGDSMSEGFNIVFNDDGTITRLSLFNVIDVNKTDEFVKLVLSKLKQKYGKMLALDDIKTNTDLLNAIDGFVLRKDGLEIFFKKYSVACGTCSTAPILLEEFELLYVAKKDISGYINALLNERI